MIELLIDPGQYSDKINILRKNSANIQELVIEQPHRMTSSIEFWYPNTKSPWTIHERFLLKRQHDSGSLLVSYLYGVIH